MLGDDFDNIDKIVEDLVIVNDGVFGKFVFDIRFIVIY